MTEKNKKEIPNNDEEAVMQENTEEIKAEDVLEEKEEEQSKPDPLNELNDKYLRLMAEFDNFKKRTVKEKTQIYTTAAADVIEALLPVLDNLSRAVATEGECDYNGVLLIQKQFCDTLEKIGVEEIKAVGTVLNPEVHNAVMHVDDESVEGEGIIVEEFVKGYKYKDRVIRHSTVKVAN